MKKIHFIRILKALALLAPILAMVLFLQTYLFYHYDSNADRIQDFYREPADTLDLVVLGASDVYSGFAPGYVYELSGLTSYPYACDSNSGALYLSQLKEILAHQDPQMIIVEVHGFLYDSDRLDDEASLRRYIENVPMSVNKVSTILQHDYEDPLSCLFPFFKYHDQWMLSAAQLSERLHANLHPEESPSVLKGFSSRSTPSPVHPAYNVNGDTSTSELDPVAHSYLIDFLEYCQSNHVDNILFVRFPHKIMSNYRYVRYQRSNRIDEIVREYGFDFLNFDQTIDDLNLDPEFDFCDEEHLSVYGQMTLTESLCDILLNEYGLEPAVQSPENQQQWDVTPAYFYAYCDVIEQRLEEGIEEQLYEDAALLEEMEQYLDL